MMMVMMMMVVMVTNNHNHGLRRQRNWCCEAEHKSESEQNPFHGGILFHL